MKHIKKIRNTVVQFTKRETEVLTWAACGKTYKEISVLLAMSEDTAKDHLERAGKKLNTGNKTHTVAVAIALGLISVHSEKTPESGITQTKYLCVDGGVLIEASKN